LTVCCPGQRGGRGQLFRLVFVWNVEICCFTFFFLQTGQRTFPLSRSAMLMTTEKFFLQSSHRNS